MYDVVVAGASVAGLICAREIAGDNSVLVIEEDYEVGTPEHCGGLVSTAGLGELGVIPFKKTMGHLIKSAQVFAPDGSNFTINAQRQKVLEIDRRELDKQIAHQAQKKGAIIKVKTSFQKITDKGIMTDKGEIKCKIFVDAMGISSLIRKDRTGILSSAQYEIYADWIKNQSVKIYLDQQKYPGFFAWIIPSGQGRGKVGVAGRGINAADTLNEFLKAKRDYSIIRRIYAPIWIKGPIEEFVDGKTVTVGDAAGQAKPTTAGGIYSSGMGGMLAGRAISKFLATGSRSNLEEYQKKWKAKFGKEFEVQLLARKISEKIDNKTINKLCRSVTPEAAKKMERDDFDFHAGTLARLLGVKGTVRIVQSVIGEKLKLSKADHGKPGKV